MNRLLWLALALVALWVVAVTAFGVVGFALHLALLAAALLFIAWLVRRATVDGRFVQP